MSKSIQNHYCTLFYDGSGIKTKFLTTRKIRVPQDQNLSFLLVNFSCLLNLAIFLMTLRKFLLNLAIFSIVLYLLSTFRGHYHGEARERQRRKEKRPECDHKWLLVWLEASKVTGTSCSSSTPASGSAISTPSTTTIAPEFGPVQWRTGDSSHNTDKQGFLLLLPLS